MPKVRTSSDIGILTNALDLRIQHAFPARVFDLSGRVGVLLWLDDLVVDGPEGCAGHVGAVAVARAQCADEFGGAELLQDCWGARVAGWAAGCGLVWVLLCV